MSYTSNKTVVAVKFPRISDEVLLTVAAVRDTRIIIFKPYLIQTLPVATAAQPAFCASLEQPANVRRQEEIRHVEYVHGLDDCSYSSSTVV